MSDPPRPRIGAEPGPLWMRAIAAAIALLPWSALRRLGAVLGWLVATFVRIRRAHVEASLRRAGIDPAAKIARGVYASLGAGLFEILWLAGRPKDALRPHFRMERACAAALRKALARGRGVVVATAHTGNWDLSACAAAGWFAEEARGGGEAPALHVVTKRLSWRALDRYWQHLRAARGVVLVDAEGAAARVREALSAGGVAVMLIDQAPERASGVAEIPFLGADALCDLGPALLAARCRAPLLLIVGHRDADGQHVLELAETIEPEELRGGHDAITAATARMASALDRFVRAHPEQWLWLHRRWKRSVRQGERASRSVPGSMAP